MILAFLAVFSGLSLNLILQLALGLGGAAGDNPRDGKSPLTVFQMGILFLSVLLLWMVFHYILPPMPGEFLAYCLFFPLSALLCQGLESMGFRLFPKAAGGFRLFSAFTGYDGLVPVALFITFNVALGFTDALVLSFFFALGNLTAVLILSEIRRRSALEWVPPRLRGSPLILISMGLLSLIFSSAAGICFKILEKF
jgi:electron transport complex protein RnfA